MLAEFLATEAYSYLIAFSRVGAVILIVPLFAQTYISFRIRLLFALGLSVAIAPSIFPYIPSLPDNFPTLAFLIVSELLIGIVIGTIVFILCTVLIWAGSIISISAGLSNAVLFNPTQGGQSAVLSVFLFLTGLTFIYATNLDHLIYFGIVRSYIIMPPGGEIFAEDLAYSIARVTGDSFLLGFQLSIPFVAFMLIYNVLLGVISRLLPQFQVFFVMLPLQLLASLALIMTILPIIITVFAEEFQSRIQSFFQF